MRPISECIIITEMAYMGAFCGTEAWIIPILRYNYAEPSDPDDPEFSGFPTQVILDFDNAISSSRWIMSEGACSIPDMDGYEECAIAVSPDQVMKRTAPLYYRELNYRISEE